jgi:pyridoxal phosphate enzyme (YggS family)
MDYRAVAERLAKVKAEITERQRRGGWSHPVRVIGVTKGHSVAAIEAAIEAGLTDVGENRVQEALAKQAELPEAGIRWHLIGPLQRNKARHAVGRFALIHSVDRPELVAELGRRCPEGVTQAVLIEVNCSGEEQKGGVAPEGLAALVEQVAAEPRLDFAGLMTMAEWSEEEAVQRRAFGRLRSLAAELNGRGHPVREMSMGMSGDYPVAIEEGATMVRLGTVLFGERER